MFRTADRVELVAAPLHGIDQLEALITQFTAGGLTVQKRIDGDLSRLTGAVRLVAYRVIQEAPINAHKHGAEHRAHLLLRVDHEEMRIVVSNPIEPDASREQRYAEAEPAGTEPWEDLGAY